MPSSTRETLFDANGFERDLKKARDASKPCEKEDEAHLAGIEFWTSALGIAGVMLAVRGAISPVAMVFLGYYKFAKFAILAHHSLHGGWGRSRRGWFAQGLYRRIIDWLDWIFPAAWIVEHNKIHHYRLNEAEDPDFVQRNTSIVRHFPTMVFRYFLVLFNAMFWKWLYYASNTLKIMHAERPGAPCKQDFDGPLDMGHLFLNMVTAKSWATFRWYVALAVDLAGVMAPPFLIHFVLIPSLAGVGAAVCDGHGWQAALLTFVNLAGAEAITNLHAFCTIVTNHAGPDLWYFNSACKADSPEFYLRAVLASTGYHAGTDLIDYFHGYLNYQAEHHAFPDLTPLHYQRLHPVFKAVCAKHGVPYVQEPVWVRVKKTAEVIVGAGKHRELDGQASEQPELWTVAPSKVEAAVGGG